MKRLLLFISILALVLLPIGCENMIGNYVERMIEEFTADYTIIVGSNSTGLNFTGEYGLVNVAYEPETENRIDLTWDHYPVEGQIPPTGYIEFTAQDRVAAMGMFQKRTEDESLLRIEIWRGEDLIAWDETTEPWGAVFAGEIR